MNAKCLMKWLSKLECT